MSAISLEVRPAQLSEFDAVLRLSTEAFADEAVLSWVVPDPAARTDYIRERFAASLRATVEAADLIIAVTPEDEAVAVALWHDFDADQRVAMSPDATEAPDCSDPIARRLHTAATVTAARHPADPHVFLSSMATRPDFRGRGVGIAMLRFGIERADGSDLPIYLEASTPQNRRLYLRNGFTDHGDTIALPEDGPVLQPMWRPPAT